MISAGPVRTARGGGRPRWLLLLAALLLGLVGVGVAAPAADAADNTLVVSEPGVREQVDRPPGFVTMAFTEEVDPSLAKMLVQDTAGNNVTVGGLVVEGTNMSSQLADGLAPGTYTVTYRLARSDGEPQGGTFQFSYGPGTFTEAADRTWSGSAEEPEVLKNPDPNAVSPQGPATTQAPSTEPGPRDPTTPGSPGATPGQPTGPTAGSSGTGTASPGGPTAGAPSTPAAPTTGNPDAAAWILGGVALLGLAGIGGAAVLRRPRPPRPR